MATLHISWPLKFIKMYWCSCIFMKFWKWVAAMTTLLNFLLFQCFSDASRLWGFGICDAILSYIIMGSNITLVSLMSMVVVYITFAVFKWYINSFSGVRCLHLDHTQVSHWTLRPFCSTTSILTLRPFCSTSIFVYSFTSPSLQKKDSSPTPAFKVKNLVVKHYSYFFLLWVPGYWLKRFFVSTRHFRWLLWIWLFRHHLRCCSVCKN